MYKLHTTTTSVVIKPSNEVCLPIISRRSMVCNSKSLCNCDPQRLLGEYQGASCQLIPIVCISTAHKLCSKVDAPRIPPIGCSAISGRPGDVCFQSSLFIICLLFVDLLHFTSSIPRVALQMEAFCFSSPFVIKQKYLQFDVYSTLDHKGYRTAPRDFKLDCRSLTEHANQGAWRGRAVEV